MRRLLQATLVLSLALFASCAAPSGERWAPSEVPMCSTMRLWEITRIAMEKEGFVVVHRGFDPKTRMAVSGWDRDLHPFRGQGIRERAHVRYKASSNAGKLTLAVRIERQVNQNLAKPLDPEYADWEAGTDNPERAKVVLQYIRSMLGTQLEIGKTIDVKEKEKEYGKWE